MAGPSSSQAASAIANAAAQYNVPPQLLLGIYGRESSFGQAYNNGGTTYGYFGLTSSGLWNPSDSFQQDADIAAKTLANLYHQTGSWDAALRKYSGGSYGQADAQNTANGNTSLLRSIVQDMVNAGNEPAGAHGTSLSDQLGNLPGVSQVSSAVNAASDTANAIGQIWTFLTTPAKWLVVLKFVGGAVLVFLALKSLTGAQTPQIIKEAPLAAVAAA